MGLDGVRVVALTIVGRCSDDAEVAGLTIVGRWSDDRVVAMTIKRAVQQSESQFHAAFRKGRWSDDDR